MAERTRTRAFLARRGARVGIAILALLATLAAWAPFLANERPYRLVASDRGALERARGEIVPLARSLASAVERTIAARGDPESVASDADALDRRLELAWPDAGSSAPSELRAAIAACRALNAGASESVLAAAQRFRAAYDGVALVAPRVTTYPLFAALTATEVFAALLPFVLAAGVVMRRRAGFARAATVGLAVAVVVAGLVGALGPQRAFEAPGALKTAVARGTVEVLSAAFAPIPFGYDETNLAEAWRPPTWLESSSGGARTAIAFEARFGEPAVDSARRHLLGTDALGRDVAARVLWGGRISLAVGAAAALLLSLIGVLLGAAAGGLGGVVDAVVSRTIEVVLCFPAFFLVLCAIAWTDPDVVPVPLAIVLVIAAVGWTLTARLVRAEALRVAASEHVLAARALGLHPARVVVRHVLPNSIGPALVAFGFAAGGAIGVESSLAFLGLGAQVPVPSWGGLVGEARGVDHAWAWIAPGALVFLAVLAWVLVAEAAREALDPRAEVAR